MQISSLKTACLQELSGKDGILHYFCTEGLRMFAVLFMSVILKDTVSIEISQHIYFSEKTRGKQSLVSFFKFGFIRLQTDEFQVASHL